MQQKKANHSRAAFEPIRQMATHEVAADNIRRAIHLGRFLPGQKLPPERMLALQLDVSRTSLRDAIRLLVDEGYVEVKRGASGGLLVLPQKVSSSRSAGLAKAREAELDQLYEFRELIEGQTARLAAERHTKADLKAIQDAVETMDRCLGPAVGGSPEAANEFSAADARFHLSIAISSANEHLKMAFENAWTARFLPVGMIFRQIEPDANEGHREIFEAIRSRDPDEAARRMTAHVQHTRAQIRDLVLMGRRKAVSRSASIGRSQGVAVSS